MSKDFFHLEHSNPGLTPCLDDVSPVSRRVVLGGGVALALGALVGCAAPPATRTGGRLGFQGVPMVRRDAVTVPPGYRVEVLYRWGDATGLPGETAPFGLSNTAADQARQAGMHHDGMAWFPLDGPDHGLLAINHEYTDDGLLHPGGMVPWTAEKMRKAMAAHGVSIIEAVRRDGRWQVVRPSRRARRITAETPMRVGGPAAGHRLLRTAADPTGTRVIGTFNNCAHGVTPWGTYLTCEENFNFYFEGPPRPDADQRRWGLVPGAGFMRWHEHDERFDVACHPNEPHRYGWVVEIDPMDPESVPVKRTALGRAAHEGATTALTRDGRVVVYMGEDARFEYLYKFVSRDPVRPGGVAANRDLLDHGTLYVARFDADGTGRWLPLVQGRGPLTAANGFADQGEVVVRTRQAADLLGATRLDRPEWTAIDPRTGTVYCSLTNNSRRGQPGRPGPDAANPRAPNPMGHILRWRERGDLDAEVFDWTHFLLAGDPARPEPQARGNVRGDAFACPDGLWIDPRGLMWIMTDMGSDDMGRGPYAHLPCNQMLACDPDSGEVRRFLVGPPGCEVSGIAMTPDLRTLFVNIQHPGEPPGDRSDPAAPTALSAWPDGHGRPRSATIAITREDGGVIGA